jgi:putative methionine-R-sulfoxide reductase with GAF domain
VSGNPEQQKSTQRQVAEVLADFAQVISQRATTSEILHQLGEYYCELLPIRGAGVLLEEQGALRFATASDELGRQIEELEERLGEGPCTTAFRTGVEVLLPDVTDASGQFPRFTAAALEGGLRAVFALPMGIRDHRVGSVDLVSDAPVELDDAQLASARLLADVAMSYIVNSRAFAEATDLAQQLQHALDSRVLIEQAKGKLSGLLGIGVGDAFELLRTQSRNSRRPLRDLAQDVLDGSLDATSLARGPQR